MSGRFIRSAANPAIRELRRLIQKPRPRRERGVAVIEGLRETERAAAAGAAIHSLVWCPDLLAGHDAAALPAPLAEVPERLVVPPDLMRKLSRRESPAPVIAVTDSPGVPLARFSVADPPLILVAERLEKPGNLGAIARTVAATGAALIAADLLPDPGNPNLIRASQGAIYEIPFAYGSSNDVFAWLAERGIPLVVADPAAPVVYWDAELNDAVAILVGNEAEGVSRTARARAEQTVRIPMQAQQTDSLNAATAAALLLYEAVRQRAAGL